jgi:hypothetical protein
LPGRLHGHAELIFGSRHRFTFTLTICNVWCLLFDVHFLSLVAHILYSCTETRPNPFLGHLFLAQSHYPLPSSASLHATLFTISAARSIQIPGHVIVWFCVLRFPSAFLFTYSAGPKLVHFFLLILPGSYPVSFALPKGRPFGVLLGLLSSKILVFFCLGGSCGDSCLCSDSYFFFFILVVLITLYHFFDSQPRVERALDSVSSVMHFLSPAEIRYLCRLICFVFGFLVW